jgi:hypothetical protein
LEIERRKALGRPTSCTSIFAAKVVCADCGGWYGKKVWGSYKGDKTYRKEVWQCNNKYKRQGKPGMGCGTPHITEEEIKAAFLLAHNTLLADREGLLEDCRFAWAKYCDCSSVDVEIIELQREIDVVIELSKKAIYENARTAQDQDDFNERNSGYLERHRAAKERMETLEAKRRACMGKAKTLETFIRDAENRPSTITEFEDNLWVSLIEKVAVNKDGTMTFVFRIGRDVTV